MHGPQRCLWCTMGRERERGGRYPACGAQGPALDPTPRAHGGLHTLGPLPLAGTDSLEAAVAGGAPVIFFAGVRKAAVLQGGPGGGRGAVGAAFCARGGGGGQSTTHTTHAQEGARAGPTAPAPAPAPKPRPRPTPAPPLLHLLPLLVHPSTVVPLPTRGRGAGKGPCTSAASTWVGLGRGPGRARHPRGHTLTWVGHIPVGVGMRIVAPGVAGAGLAVRHIVVRDVAVGSAGGGRMAGLGLVNPRALALGLLRPALTARVRPTTAPIAAGPLHRVVGVMQGLLHAVQHLSHGLQGSKGVQGVL